MPQDRTLGGPILSDITTSILGTSADEGRAPADQPVRVVADRRLAVGPGLVPLYLSADWDRPLPGIDRAIITLHGRRRDADVYLGAAENATSAAGDAAAGSLLTVPQFLAETDVRQHRLPPAMLHWTLEGWMGGEAAVAPAPTSSFEVIDAILDRLADRAIFPTLRHVVLAGHSGGGQVAQRYAVLGRGGDRLQAAGVALRYVVANPSSYVYFGPDRPGPVAGCDGFDRWKYGMAGLPPYAGSRDPAALEADYVRREVVYLWGGADVDPNQPALDKSCAAAAQGANRLERGQAYFAHLKARHPTLAHRASVVPGVGHDGTAMFGSPPGLAALFDKT